MAELVWKQAREAARKVLDGNWDQQLPVKIERICRACGVTTYKCVMPDGSVRHDCETSRRKGCEGFRR